jgi:hypothetical protein
MTRVSWMWAIAVAAACGRSMDRVATTPQLSDACALHDTAEACKADVQCEVRPNGVACPSAGACREFACVTHGAPTGAGTPGNPPSCACTMTSGTAMAAGVCVEQVGGPAVQAGAPPSLSCRTMCASTTGDDPCGCVAQGSIERCSRSPSVQNLCVCDDGVR